MHPHKTTFQILFFFIIIANMPVACFSQWNGDTVTGGKLIIKSVVNDHKSFVVTDGNGGTIQIFEQNIYPPETPSKSILLQHTDSSANLLWGTAANARVFKQGSNTYGLPSLLDAKSDNTGGAYILYMSYPVSGNTDSFCVYIQHINVNGNATWPGNGTELLIGASGIESLIMAQGVLPFIVDSSGAAIVAWGNGIGQHGQLFVQKISPGGRQLWQTGGVRICSAGNPRGGFSSVTDNNGGAIIIFGDARNGIYDSSTNQFDKLEIYAQHVNASGTELYGPGGLLAAGAAGENMVLGFEIGNYYPIAPDNSGGCYFIYSKIDNSDTTEYIQKINSDGQKSWGAYGIQHTIANGKFYQGSIYKRPGGGVACIYFVPNDASADKMNMGLQYYNEDGTTAYPFVKTITKMASAGAEGIVNRFDLSIQNDGSAFLFFMGEGEYQIPKLQKIAADGTLAWDSIGKTIVYGYSSNLQLIQGENGYTTLQWHDSRFTPDGNANNVFISRVNSNGDLPVARHTFFSINDGNWNEPSTREEGIVPGPDDIVWIYNNVAVTSNASCYSLSIQPGGNITVASGVNLVVLH